MALVQLYSVLQDFDQDPDDLAALEPQPASPNGLQRAGRVPAANGHFYPQGELYIELIYTMIESNTEREDIDGQFGVSEDVVSSEVTLGIRDNHGDWVAYNAIVEYPETGKNATRWGSGWRNVKYICHLKVVVT